MTAVTKLSIILMLSASAFCLWSVAWMGVTVFRLIRDAL